ncbi:MAG: EscU/YscU/HrcU family type III secretion system export apparatus switch protein [Candidatus Eremiobacteraeota bacterium]|nr:EscU/YscU/HrcU family type III secretion system export apparatus switch protein [Candidatus Eremiobacteraeota bacterium]MBV8434257.1 EscU/YscU/HrcU family type III secretion system export apparatus switch protein [Candidatus Eremiobacteraeota bacterium]MBV8721185.1 EscU/YscU/HrcU family type III secretion system export apparatus switch protein [Candidatus Eremiobacteraeota bacterium]
MSFFDFRKREKRPAAAALTYDPIKPEPPQILAVGRGRTAEEIVRIAKENGVPLHEDPGLVEALAMLDVSDYIPRELYAVVAEILSYVFRVDAGVRKAG